MGCDGGTIPRRDELVRTKKKPEQKDKDSELSFRWRHCAISQDPLQSPIVACGLGRLYNKDTVIETLLDKTNVPEVAKHIKNLKDIKELNLTPNPAFKPSAEKGDAYIDRQLSPYICPVIGLEMNGKFRFVFPWTCGCVVSERALKEIKTSVCHKCQQLFSEEDVVILNGNKEEQDLMKVRLDSRHARLKAEKKARSEAKAKSKCPETVVASTSKESATCNDDKVTGNEDTVDGSKIDAVTSSSKASCNDKGTGKEKKIVANGSKINGAPKRAATEEVDLVDPEFKKTKGSYSIAKDPGATSVYKSLFTSHDSASKHPTAHWVTYNPFYN